MRKIFSNRLWLLGICLAIMVAVLVSTQRIYAEGGGQAWSGPGGTGSGGNSNCESRTFSKATWNRCGGVTWVLRPVDTAHAKCVAIGATHYYKLGGNLFTGSGLSPSYTGDIGKALKTSYAYLLPYRNGVSANSVPRAQADADYLIAKQYLPPGSPSWADTGEFCWNPAWGTPNDPPTPPGNTDDTIYGEGSFWADSYLTVSNEVATHEASVSTKEGSEHESVTIKVSTDNSATVTFRHTMSYDRELWDPTAPTYANAARSGHAPKSTDEFEEIKTKLKIQQYGGSGNSSIKDEDFGTGKSGAKSGQDVATTTVTLSPAKGETLSVCQVLTHTSVKYIIKGEDEDTTTQGAADPVTGVVPDPVTTHDDWKFTKYDEDNNTGFTMLCAEVYRPEDPDGEDPKTWAKTQGNNDATPMYAGQTSEIGWNVRAEWEEARRVTEWKAIAFTVPSDIGHDHTKLEGNTTSIPRQNVEPCAYYGLSHKGLWGNHDTWCDVIGGRSASSDLGDAGTHDYSEKETIALQDYVGYKYCASFGYKWQYWFTISYDDQDYWQYENAEYWTNFDAACRTIAKKPSTAFWNSGVLTNGGVKTSLSPRITNFINDGKAQTATSNQFDYLYGSWSEHLAAIGGYSGTSNKFGSGSSLSRGSGTSNGGYNDIATSRSPMTIANTSGTPGNSGIRTSDTLRTRLNTYLSQQAAPSSSLSNIPISGGEYHLGRDGGTKIININGDLTIDRNITVDSGNYDSIYQIPQVVIFVDGNVEIKGDVTEIDAWIIATGTLNTCKEFNGSTQTASKYYTSNTVVCDKQLTFNGPVMASKADLRRSYGSDPVIQGARYTPGEVFNLSGENYLWAYAQAGRYSSSYTEAYSRELAPRY